MAENNSGSHEADDSPAGGAEFEAQPSDRFAELAALEVRHAELAAALNEQATHTRDLKDQLHGQVQARIEDITEEYSNLPEAEHNVPLHDFLAAKSGIPPEYVEALADEHRLKAEEANLAEQLEEYAPEKRELLQTEVSALVARIDYDAVASKLIEPKNMATIVTANLSNSISQGKELPGARRFSRPSRAKKADLSTDEIRVALNTLIGTDQLLAANVEANYDQLSHAKDSIDALVPGMQHAGLLLDEPIEQPMEETPHNPRAEVLQAYEQRIEMIKFTSRLADAGIIRNTYGSKFANVIQIQELDSIIIQMGSVLSWKPKELDSFEEAFTTDGLVLDRRLLDALRIRAEQLLARTPPELRDLSCESARYQAEVKKARAIDVEGALDRLQVSGLEQLPFELTETQLKAYVRQYVPPIAVADVSQVEVRELTPDEEKSDTQAALYSAGVKHGEGKIIMSLGYMKRLHGLNMEHHASGGRVSEEIQKIIDTHVSGKFLYFLMHEYGHALHFNMELAALERWEQEIANDERAMTEYVADSRAADAQKGKIEDFAESAAHLINSPEKLLVGSETRLRGMLQIYIDYFPNFADGLGLQLELLIQRQLSSAMARGKTIAELRRQWFPHDYADDAQGETEI